MRRWPLPSHLAALALTLAATAGTMALAATHRPARAVAAAVTLPPLPGLPGSSPGPTASPTPAAAAPPTPSSSPEPAAPAPTPVPTPQPPCGNHFARGWCTYWVAAHRCVPWFGDAFQWLERARAAGYRVGRTAVVGAIAVWGASQAGASRAGHVALVVAVHGELVEVTEMNWTYGWDREDRRTIRPWEVRGYVYPP